MSATSTATTTRPTSWRRDSTSGSEPEQAAEERSGTVGRALQLTVGLILVATPLRAGTFDRSPIAPDLGLDALTRSVARQQLGRDLFANPYATVTIGNTDVYDKFPYV